MGVDVFVCTPEITRTRKKGKKRNTKKGMEQGEKSKRKENKAKGDEMGCVMAYKETKGS